MPDTTISSGEGRFAGLRRDEGWGFRLYDALYPFVTGLLWAAAPFHAKLRAALQGKSQTLRLWKEGTPDERKLILAHVASRGELEGAIPLLDRLIVAGHRVALSYTSPSAEGGIQSIKGLWKAGYLPHDVYETQIRFLARLEPSLILIFKHDFWPNLLRAARTLKIPAALVNGNFHPRSRRGMPLTAGFHRRFMRGFRAVWTVSEADAGRARRLCEGVEVTAIGDTRFDRVMARVPAGRERFRELAQALQTGPVIVAGSTWQPCEQRIWFAFTLLQKEFPTLKLILAPHEPRGQGTVRNLKAAIRAGLKVRLFSDWQGGVIPEPVLLIDRVGVLADLYSVGWAAYVGGGFGKGVHSILEPAAYGLPVAFGPRHHVAHEAGLLLEAKGGFEVRTARDLLELWRGWLTNPASHRRSADAAARVVRDHAGVAERLMQLVEPLLKG